MDISKETDITKLKVTLADEYNRREQARMVVAQTERNISAINQRVEQLIDEPQNLKSNKTASKQ
jgi:hypothetical protein